MNDRKPEGCIGNGITRNEGDLSQLSCSNNLLHGYGLPATSIWMAPNGAVSGMDDRNNPSSDFFNQACADGGPSPGTSHNPPGNGNDPPFTTDKHNYLEYGSETPHQIGWYLVTLATEYELLGRNGQYEEQQRTLEDLFLALQAYRRLDITANCLVKERYDEITNGVEVCPDGGQVVESCLCMEKYHNHQCEGWLPWKWNFDIECKANCPWSPDLSGYSGFFIRADPTQEQEILHDPSEDKWNIDLVGGAFAMAQKPPCDDNFSAPCYMERHVGYVSQDQLFSIMMGLAMVKRYIPPTATVTTCDGAVYNPFDIVQDIAKGFVKLPENTTRHIFWPGSSDDDCCAHAIKFSECAGGNLQWTYAGVEYMYNYINVGDDDHHVEALDRWKWGKLFNRTFFAEAMSIGFDIGDYGSGYARKRIISACNDDGKEILLLMNNLLYPAQPDVPVSKGFFESLLCRAPCGGPCSKPYDYDNHSEDWPAFECPNTPDWTGQRWEGHGEGQGIIKDARQFNGLDYMALYNIYMLYFPEEKVPYYHPDRPEPTLSGHFLGEDKIEGPSTLCPGQSGTYRLKGTYSPTPTFSSLTWESSSNINLLDVAANPTSATMMTALTPSYLGVFAQERFTRLQYYYAPGMDPATTPMTEPDVCDLPYRKPILSELPDYTIVPEIIPCRSFYVARAVNPYGTSGVPLPDEAYAWEALNNTTGAFIDGDGPLFDFDNVLPLPHHGGQGTITLTLYVHTGCGDLTKTLDIPYTVCPLYQPRLIVINPNPAQNQIAVRIAQGETEDFVSTDPNGVRIQIYPASGGSTTLMDTYLYTNGQYFNVANLPNGVYQVRAFASDLTLIQANLAIVR
ncbi:MAG: hypothetical protein ACKVUS_01095 [Saprospiraceae bacterium]